MGSTSLRTNLSLRAACALRRGGLDMSSYANYCQDQAADCARRARLASSPEIIVYCRNLELRWLKRAEKAGDALGHENDPAVTLLPLRHAAAATYRWSMGTEPES